jgi:hypothetical protein
MFQPSCTTGECTTACEFYIFVDSPDSFHLVEQNRGVVPAESFHLEQFSRTHWALPARHRLGLYRPIKRLITG